MLTGRVLGPTEVEADGDPVDLGGPLPRRLVTALLAAQGRPVGTGPLAEAIWGGDPPASPDVSLHAYVSRLRRALGRHRDALQRAGGGYRLQVGESDATRFAADAARARELLGADRPAEALRVFDEALALWRGDAYAELADTPAAEAERTRLDEWRAVVVEERLAALLAVGDAPGAVGALESAVRSEPYRERRWELLILALYRCGRQADALAALRRVRSRLADDLGIDPGPAVQELEGRLLAQDPALLLPPTRPAARRPTVPAARRPTVPAAPQPTGPAAIRRPLTRFLGRGGELALLDRVLVDGRLVTVVGPGGAGKTRLVVEFAADRQPWFVRLADVADPELVVTAVAAGTGVRGGTAEALAAALGDRPGLLVLDNCEHLTDAVATLVLDLLAACPGLRVLATSREPLGVDGERLFPLGTLPAADAVALLTDRIAAVRPGWRPTPAEARQLHGIAAALDGIPLALELAAGRARVLGLGELLEMLDDRFPALGPVPRGALAPHQTLEAAIAWSFDLLPAADRALLLRLWPFQGGFTPAAVNGDLTALSSLVARSVVVADTTVAPSRYRLLGLVRAFCRDHDPDPAGSLARHAAWVRDLVERYTPELRGERSAHAIRVLNRELANLRTGIAHDLAVAPVAALRTVGLLDWFWFRGGHVVEGTRLIEAALAGAPDGPPTDRCRAWMAAASLWFMAGDLGTAERSLRAGLAELGTGPDPEGQLLQGQAAYYEALLWRAVGDFSAAAEHARRSIEMAHRIGESHVLAAGTMALGSALVGLSPAATEDRLSLAAEGRRLLAAAAARAAERGEGWTEAMSELLLSRALLSADPPEPAAALAAVRKARARFAYEDDIGNMLACLHTGAYALVVSGRADDGAVLLAAARRHATHRGLDLDRIDPLGTAALEAALDAALPGADRAVARSVADELDETAMTALLECA